MRYWVPELALPKPTVRKGVLASLFRASRPNPVGSARERLGGQPVGLPAGMWPKCRECGLSESLIAQFDHHADRLDLGREGRVLFVFQCAHDPGMCATWEAFSGANSCFIVEPEQLVDGQTSLPADVPPLDHEVWISSWIERDDGISPDAANAFWEETSFRELSEELLAGVTWSTRLAGLPRWMQSPDEGPRPDWRFIGQLDGSYSFLSPPQTPPAWVQPDAERYEGRTHIASGPNFGGGLAYLFLQDGAELPKVCMMWQR